MPNSLHVASPAVSLNDSRRSMQNTAVASPAVSLINSRSSMQNFQQFWMSSMFSPGVVGTANGLSGGWGNLGGGATQLSMLLVYSLIHSHIGSIKFTAWRIAFFIPAFFQTLRLNVNLRTARIIAASFGLANLFSRPGGGMLSDLVAKRFGMRGRLWTLWVVQMIGGLLCLILGEDNGFDF